MIIMNRLDIWYNIISENMHLEGIMTEIESWYIRVVNSFDSINLDRELIHMMFASSYEDHIDADISFVSYIRSI